MIGDMLDKVFKPIEAEAQIYQMWEEGGYFTPKIDKTKKPFSILLPLPNANDPMHMGHALFTIQDILVRYHRMLGEPTLWLPGADHAGIETQFVFEKRLSKEGKSRFDFDRETLYQKVWQFVEENREINREQLKKLGFSLDWTRYHYSLEPAIVKQVLTTFRKMHSDGLIYRGERLVNYCTRCGTAYSDLEVNYEEKEDSLYFLNYGSIQIATTRPETIFADVAVAINPKDKRARGLCGKNAVIPLLNLEIPIITDPAVELNFGTGALKITPGYDPIDFTIGQKNELPIITVISRTGRMDFSHPRFSALSEEAKKIIGELSGLSVKQGRAKTVELLEGVGKLVKQEPLRHSVGVCYKCSATIEPMVIPQWFVKTKLLAEPALRAVRSGRTKIVPKKRFEKMYFDWMENIRDWNISRQVVWGPRLPVWYCLDCNPELQINFIDNTGSKVSGLWKELKRTSDFSEIQKGLQSLVAAKDATYQLTEGRCLRCQSSQTLQETDTFDTWFLSGQWPLTTLGFNVEKPEESFPDFKYFYPTSVLDTLWDILFFWVGRMMIFGLYLTGEVPFHIVHIHARVTDKFGAKMSKSKGNVIDPLLLVNQYGADALRLSLVMGIAPASDIAISDEKVRGARNFANKLWNIGRFILMNLEGREVPWYEKTLPGLTADDKQIVKKLDELIMTTTKDLNNFRLGQAAENLYQFIWHEFADNYVELSKERIKSSDPVVLSVLRHVFLNCLKLLHPFMPFVTEQLWQSLPRLKNEPLIISAWPKRSRN